MKLSKCGLRKVGQELHLGIACVLNALDPIPTFVFQMRLALIKKLIQVNCFGIKSIIELLETSLEVLVLFILTLSAVLFQLALLLIELSRLLSHGLHAVVDKSLNL